MASNPSSTAKAKIQPARASVALTAPPSSSMVDTMTDGGRLRVAHGVPVCAFW